MSRDLDLLGTREALSRRLHQRASAEREQVGRDVLSEETRLTELEVALVRSREQAAAAMREIYKQSSMAGYASVLAVRDPRKVLRGLQSLDVVARRQRDAIHLYESQRLDSLATAERLQQRRADLERSVKTSIREERRLASARKERLAFLARVDKERSMHRQAMEELTRAAREMEEAIASLPPGADPPGVTIDFRLLEGTLPWPAPGAMLRPFGTVRHPRFGTETPHPGWDIGVEPGSGVTAVAAGRVVFSRRFGGYGPTVVIDHGGRYLSVYARLAAATVPEGTEMLPGGEVGFSSEADDQGKSFIYFEIRHQGLAVDPARWLRRSHGREAR